jgi:hypothetical protein
MRRVSQWHKKHRSILPWCIAAGIMQPAVTDDSHTRFLVAGDCYDMSFNPLRVLGRALGFTVVSYTACLSPRTNAAVQHTGLEEISQGNSNLLQRTFRTGG